MIFWIWLLVFISALLLLWLFYLKTFNTAQKLFLVKIRILIFIFLMGILIYQFVIVEQWYMGLLFIGMGAAAFGKYFYDTWKKEN